MVLVSCSNSSNPYILFICNQNISNLPESGVITTNMSKTSDGKYTNSMYPTFNETSKLTVQRVHPDTILNVGDIIEFKVPKDFGCIMIHRIIKIGEDNKGIYYITKGDNILLSDNSMLSKPIRKEDMLYKIIKIE